MSNPDITSVLLWALLLSTGVSLTAIVSLVQILKWVLIGKGLLERRELEPLETGVSARPVAVDERRREAR